MQENPETLGQHSPLAGPPVSEADGERDRPTAKHGALGTCTIRMGRCSECCGVLPGDPLQVRSAHCLPKAPLELPLASDSQRSCIHRPQSGQLRSPSPETPSVHPASLAPSRWGWEKNSQETPVCKSPSQRGSSPPSAGVYPSAGVTSPLPHPLLQPSGDPGLSEGRPGAGGRGAGGGDSENLTRPPVGGKGHVSRALH